MAMFDEAWTEKFLQLAPNRCRNGHRLRSRAAKPFIRDYGSGVDWTCIWCRDSQTVVLEGFSRTTVKPAITVSEPVPAMAVAEEA